MKHDIHRQVVLTRCGDPEAQAALFSLPLPRNADRNPTPDYPCVGSHPLAWWKRGSEPRRVLTAVTATPGSPLPSTLHLRDDQEATSLEPSPWSISTELTTERLPFVPPVFTDIDALRGVPAADCTTLEHALVLTYGNRTIRLQPGATGPGTAECLWQNVQVDRLWRNSAAEAVRVGGIIYNEDTYLRADLYLILFINGVVSATLHFANSKLHIKGYDFRGLPYLKISADDLAEVNTELPCDGWRHDLGAACFNFEDAGITCSETEPARLHTQDGAAYFQPFSRIVHEQLPNVADDEWAPGFARTVRFQFTLGEAPPVVARYTIPAWWYALCGEPWAGELLPVHGRFTPVSVAASTHVRSGIAKGAFDAGSVASLGKAGNDGGAGAGLMQQAYLSGDPGEYDDAFTYCTYWADLAVDHSDFTVHQWLGGWGWKTCAYTKFRDVLFAYLETGDPWMLDTTEMVADTYWAWFRSNWPRNTIGRDAFELGGWTLLWRYLRTDHVRERTLELVRMICTVLETRGAVGGQMGAGVHPGWHASLYMTGVVFTGMLEALEAAGEAGEDLSPYFDHLRTLHRHYTRDDVELFPVDLGRSNRASWSTSQLSTWSLFALHAYAGTGRLYGFSEDMVQEGLAKTLPSLEIDTTAWGEAGRAGDQHLHPRIHDALMLGARLAEDGQGVDLAPAFGPQTLPWPERQVVDTPWGALTLTASQEGERVQLSLETKASFRVRIETAGKTLETQSIGEVIVAGD